MESCTYDIILPGRSLRLWYRKSPKTRTIPHVSCWISPDDSHLRTPALSLFLLVLCSGDDKLVLLMCAFTQRIFATIFDVTERTVMAKKRNPPTKTTSVKGEIFETRMGRLSISRGSDSRLHLSILFKRHATNRISILSFNSATLHNKQKKNPPWMDYCHGCDGWMADWMAGGWDYGGIHASRFERNTIYSRRRT